MKVFLSWSGDRSKAIADVIRQWLPAVIQAVRPYFSPDDITKGSRWSTEIAKELEESRIGIICLTRENLVAPWIMFEAGALSKRIDKSRVCPLLFGIDPTDVTGPLVQFQASRFDKSEMKRVVRMMNTELADSALAPDVLDSVFEMWWPRLEEKIRIELEKAEIIDEGGGRPERDLLEEILQLTRSIASSSRTGRLHPAAIDDMTDALTELLEKLVEVGLSDMDLFQECIEKLRQPLFYLVRHLPPSQRRAEIRLRLNSIFPAGKPLDQSDVLQVPPDMGEPPVGA